MGSRTHSTEHTPLLEKDIPGQAEFVAGCKQRMSGDILGALVLWELASTQGHARATMELARFASHPDVVARRPDASKRLRTLAYSQGYKE